MNESRFWIRFRRVAVSGGTGYAVGRLAVLFISSALGGLSSLLTGTPTPTPTPPTTGTTTP